MIDLVDDGENRSNYEDEQPYEIPDTQEEYVECYLKCSPLKIVSHAKFKECFLKCFSEKLDEVFGTTETERR